MDNNNPADMSNEDLEKDMQKSNEETKLTGNQEHVSQSTAAEGILKTPSEDTSTNEGEEQELDDLGYYHTKEDSQDGSLPSPEDTPEWEDDDTDNNKAGS